MKSVYDLDGDDTQLLIRARRFDPDALRTLHKRFYEPVYRYVQFKVADSSVCEDLTSEVFVRLLEALRQGRVWRTTPDAWIFGIARNVVVDHYRNKGRRAEVALDEDLASAPDDGPVKHVMAVEQHEALAQAMAMLTDEQRDVVLMRFMEGLNIKDVADALNKTPGAIKGLQFRALKTLSEIMQRFSDEATGGSVYEHGIETPI
jgi:RNA polymerase sigma-70 factor (ECF subfamily)